MNEAETRAEHIDPALASAGWGVVEGSRIRREYAIAPGRIEGPGRRRKPLFLGVRPRFTSRSRQPSRS
jgi:type I restriction enzyme R subunit